LQQLTNLLLVPGKRDKKQPDWDMLGGSLDTPLSFPYSPRVAVEVADEAGRTLLIAEAEMQMKRLH
jgi:hypothetical protein